MDFYKKVSQMIEEEKTVIFQYYTEWLFGDVLRNVYCAEKVKRIIKKLPILLENETLNYLIGTHLNHTDRKYWEFYNDVKKAINDNNAQLDFVEHYANANEKQFETTNYLIEKLILKIVGE